MIHRTRLALASILAALAGCDGTTTPATDAATDAFDASRTDVANPADAPALDAPRADVVDAATPCPASRPFGACAVEGQTCDYRDPRPECGGINLSCRNGQWTENFHTDPSAACFDAAAPDAPVDASAPDVPANDVPRADVVPPADAGNACAAVGGICVASATVCASGGGAVRAEGAAGCRFSDGDGACCAPPEAQPTGESCAARGGLCAPIAGCNFVGGSFAPSTGSGCTGVPNICCLPAAVCGPEEQVCCGDTASFRPACDRGAWRCTIEGTRLVPRATCTF